MARKIAKASLLLLVLMMVGCDHATKHAATSLLSARHPVEVVPGVLDLTYSRNHDTAFSLLARFGIHDGMLAISLVSLAVLAGIGFMWFKRRTQATRLEHVGYALAIAGAIGNVADRLVRGFVVDFIHIHHWPVFNVADMLIVVGMGLLLVASLRKRSGTGTGTGTGTERRATAP